MRKPKGKVERLPDDPALDPEATRERQLSAGMAAKKASRAWKRAKKRRGRERKG